MSYGLGLLEQQICHIKLKLENYTYENYPSDPNLRSTNVAAITVMAHI